MYDSFGSRQIQTPERYANMIRWCGLTYEQRQPDAKCTKTGDGGAISLKRIHVVEEDEQS